MAGDMADRGRPELLLPPVAHSVAPAYVANEHDRPPAEKAESMHAFTSGIDNTKKLRWVYSL